MDKNSDRIKGLLLPKVLTGTADIDISAAVYTAYVELMKITPSRYYGCRDLVVDLDLNKATTGWDAVSTASDTLDIAVFIKTDGTNFRRIMNTAQFVAVGGGGHATAGVRIPIGLLALGQEVSIRVKLNAERADVEIPYRVTYIAQAAPVIVAVAA